MGRASKAKRERRRAPSVVKQTDWRRQHLIAVGVTLHPTTEHYQVWLHARGQIAMLLAFRTVEQADAAKRAVGEALLRGDFATPERWCASLAAIGADSDVELEGVPDSVFADIRATIQGANLRLPTAAAHTA
jgi:hypothetical protein